MDEIADVEKIIRDAKAQEPVKTQAFMVYIQSVHERMRRNYDRTLTVEQNYKRSHFMAIKDLENYLGGNENGTSKN